MTGSPASAPASESTRAKTSVPRLYFVDCSECLASPSFVDPDQLDRFAQVLKRDPAFSGAAEPLLSRPSEGRWFTIGGVTIGAGLTAFALFNSSETCSPSPCDTGPDTTLLLAAAGIAAAGIASHLLYNMLDHPTQAEVIDPLNRWNASHPDQAFRFDPQRGSLLPASAAPSAPTAPGPAAAAARRTPDEGAVSSH